MIIRRGASHTLSHTRFNSGIIFLPANCKIAKKTGRLYGDTNRAPCLHIGIFNRKKTSTSCAFRILGQVEAYIYICPVCKVLPNHPACHSNWHGWHNLTSWKQELTYKNKLHIIYIHLIILHPITKHTIDKEFLPIRLES